MFQLDQRELGGEEVQRPGGQAQARRDRSALPDAVGRDPLDGDRRAADDDQPGRPCGMSRMAAKTARARSAPPVSGPSSCVADRDLRRRAEPGHRVDSAGVEKRSSRSATGGLTSRSPSRPARSPPVASPPRPPPRLRVVQRQRDRLDQPSGLVEPAPLEPGVPQVGHDAKHGLDARGRHGRRPRVGADDAAPCGCVLLPALLRKQLDDPVEELRDPLPGDGRDRQHLAVELRRDPRRASSAPVTSILVTTSSSGRSARAGLYCASSLRIVR